MRRGVASNKRGQRARPAPADMFARNLQRPLEGYREVDDATKKKTRKQYKMAGNTRYL